MTALTRGLLASAMFSLAGCAAQSAVPTARTTAGAAQPGTGDFLADPVFSPPPATSEPRTGGPTAAATSGSADQARQLVLRIVDGLRRADASGVEQLFADPVLRVRAGRYILRERLAAQCLRAAAPLAWNADSDATQIVDTENIDVQVLRSGDAIEPLPPGLMASDLRVRVRLRPKHGGRTRKQATELPCLSHIYVRAGPSPTVVAID